MKNNITKKINWFDPDSTETIKLVAQAYSFKIKSIIAKRDTSEVDVVISGPTENISKFEADLEAGEVQPMSNKKDMSDSEYQAWLKYELAKLGVSYHPNKINKEIVL